jgi:hypothetical protein
MPDYPKFEGWPDGENNLLVGDELPITSLRRAVNYDITDGGGLVRRRGRTRIYAGSPTPGTLFSNGNRVLFVESGNLWELVLLNTVWTRILVRLSVGARPMYYVSINDYIYYSNGVITGVLTDRGEDLPWGIQGPANQPTILAASGGGTLAAGNYQVAITFLSAAGEESGTPTATEVIIVDGGSIEMRDIPTPVDGSLVRVYCSSPGGEGLYRIGELIPGTPSYRISDVANARGLRLQTQFGIKPPAGDVLEYFNGRIYIGQGKVVWYTEPLRYGLVKPHRSFLMFPEDVTVIKAVADGLYICADQTYWLSGIDTNQFQQRPVLPYGAVKGTGINIPKSDNVAWFSKFGMVVGGLEAQVSNIQEEKSAVSEFENGAMIFREQKSLRQIIATLGTGTQSVHLAPDYVTLETARRGSAI